MWSYFREHLCVIATITHVLARTTTKLLLTHVIATITHVLARTTTKLLLTHVIATITHAVHVLDTR